MKTADILRISGIVAQTQALLQFDLLGELRPHTTVRLVAEVPQGIPPTVLLPLSAYGEFVTALITKNLIELEQLGVNTQDMLSAYKLAGQQIMQQANASGQQNEKVLDTSQDT